MTITTTLFERNRSFAKGFAGGELPILPKMRTVILTCVDARVDPAYVLGLELGDAVILRNNGGRVTQDVIEEIATLSFMVGLLEGGSDGSFEVVIMHHTQCGAERFADPAFQGALKEKLGIDVSAHAISDPTDSIKDDIQRLRDAPQVPEHLTVSGLLYDVKSGNLKEVVSAATLG